MTGTRRARRGFTLVEVLVALAIVAIGMAAVLETLGSSANTIMYLRDKTFAQWVALNQIANMRLTAEQQNQSPQVGDTDGDVDFADRKWHWRQEITATELPGIVRIDVMVRPSDAPGDDTHGWYTTVSGMYGDEVAPARGDTPTWGNGGNMGAQPGAQGGGYQTLGSDSDSFFGSSSSSSSSTGSDSGVGSFFNTSSSDDLLGSGSSSSSSSSDFFK